jgi:hypothetical protein
VHETVRRRDENVWKQRRANLAADSFLTSLIFRRLPHKIIPTGVPTMKRSALLFVTLLTTPALFATVHAGDQTTLTTGTVSEIAKQYADGGPYGGVTSGHTGPVLQDAQDSMRYLGTVDQVAANWPMPPVLAKGE